MNAYKNTANSDFIYTIYFSIEGFLKTSKEKTRIPRVLLHCGTLGIFVLVREQPIVI